MSEMNKAANTQPPFADFLGLKITYVSPERVSAEPSAGGDGLQRRLFSNSGVVGCGPRLSFRVRRKIYKLQVGNRKNQFERMRYSASRR